MKDKKDQKVGGMHRHGRYVNFPIQRRVTTWKKNYKKGKKTLRRGSFRQRLKQFFYKDSTVYIPSGWQQTVYTTLVMTYERGKFKSLYVEDGELIIEVDTNSLLVFELCQKLKEKCRSTCQVCGFKGENKVIEWREQKIRVCPVCEEKKKKSEFKIPKKPEERLPRPTPISIVLKNQDNEKLKEYYSRKRKLDESKAHFLECLKYKNREGAEIIYKKFFDYYDIVVSREPLFAMALLLGDYDNLKYCIDRLPIRKAWKYLDFYNEVKLISRVLAAELLFKMVFPIEKREFIYPELAKEVGWVGLINAMGCEVGFPEHIVPEKFRHML